MTDTMRTVAFGLGGNMGDAAETLRGAASLLSGDEMIAGARLSPLFATRPVGGPPQPDFVNAVLVATTAAAPQYLLGLAHRVEARYGRTRDVRWGPRTLDVDLLAVGDLVSADPVLTLPHPRAHLRAFVLLPWSRIDPQFDVPGRGTVARLLDALDVDQRSGVVELPQDRTGSRAGRR